MKAALLIVTATLVVASHGHCQGTVTFSNILPSNVASSPRVFLQSDTGETTFVPTGSQFTVELMFAPDGTSSDAFGAAATRVGATTFFFPLPGLFGGGNRTVAAISPAGGYGLFQVRVWETVGGPNYLTAVASGDPSIRVGTSAILRVDTSDPTTVPPGIPASLVAAGLQSFTLTPVPEPSVIAFALLAAGWLFVRRKF